MTRLVPIPHLLNLGTALTLAGCAAFLLLRIKGVAELALSGLWNPVEGEEPPA